MSEYLRVNFNPKSPHNCSLLLNFTLPPTLKIDINLNSHRTMAFSREPFPNNQSEASIKKYGADTPFKHNKVVREYIESLLNRNGYQDLVEYNTTVERVEKVMCEKENSSEWKVTLRRRGYDNDYWWVEYFDAVVVASGHFWVPWIPHIEGLADFVKKHPDRVEHSKSFRRPEKYQGKVNMNLLLMLC